MFQFEEPPFQLETFSEIHPSQTENHLPDEDTLAHIYVMKLGCVPEDFFCVLSAVVNWLKGHSLNCNTLLAKLAAELILMGGDFNMVSDPRIDRSGQPLPSDGALSTALNEFRIELTLTDV